MPQTRMTDIQLNSASLTSLKNEVAAARGTSFTLKDYIDSKTNGLDDYRITGASYDAVNSVLNINVAPGRASIMDVLVEKSAATTVSVDSPSVATTFYVYLIYDGSFQVNTTGSVPVNGIYLGAVTTGATLSDSIVVGDHRPRLVRGAAGGSGSSSQELVDARSGYATLNDRLNSMAGASGSQTYQETFADASHVDTLATDATVDSRGVRVAKGTATVEDFSSRDRIDTASTDSVIVVDTTNKEARTTRNATQAVLQTLPIATAGTSNVALSTTEQHETFFSPGAEATISAAGYNNYQFSQVQDNTGRVWTFWKQSATTIYGAVYNADGSTAKPQTAVWTASNGTTTYALNGVRAFLGKDGKVWIWTVVTNSNVYIALRSFALDFSDFSGQNVSSGWVTLPSNANPDPTGMTAAVDANGRMWVAMNDAAAGVKFAIYNADGTLFRGLTAHASAPSGTQVLPYLLPTSDGRMALALAVFGNGPNGRACQQMDYYISLWNLDGSLYQGLLLVNDRNIFLNGNYTFMPAPVLMEMPTGKIQYFIQTDAGLARSTIDLSTWTVSRTAQSLTQDVNMGLAAGTSFTTGNRRCGYIIRPTRDLLLVDVAAWVQNPNSTTAYSAVLHVLRQDPFGMTEIFNTSANMPVSTSAPRWFSATAFLKAGQTYFICIDASTNQGVHYGASTPSLQTYEWGTVQAGILDTSSSSNVAVADSHWWNMYFTFDNNCYFKLARVQYSYPQISLAYAQGDPAIGLLYRASSPDSLAYYSDYPQVWMAHLDPTNFALVDDFKVEDVVQNYSYLPYVSRHSGFWAAWYTRNAAGLKRVPITSTTTTLSYQISVDGGVSWRAITGDGTPVNFTTAGTNLVLRATFSSGRAKFTPHLKGYTLTEWPGTGAALTRTFISKSLPARNPSARANLATVQTLNGGTINWYLTNDGGNTWQQTVPGGSVNFNTWGGSDVRVKAVLSSPSAQNLSPVISSYTLVTGDTVAANLVEDRMRTREIEALKMMLEIDALKGASKNRLLVTVTDTFNDASGIDAGLSSGHVFDATNKLVYPQTYPGSVDASYDPASFTMSATLGTTSGGSIVKYGQSFVVGRNGSISSVKLKITSKPGNPGAIKLDLMDSGLTTVLASGTILESQVLTDGSWTEILFSAPYAVTAGQTYVLMASLVTPAPANVYYALGGTNTSGYASGTAWYSNSTVSGGAYQQSTTNDIAFQTLMGGQPPCAIVVSTADTAAAAPSKIYLTAQELLNAGSITYYVSRDSGTTWTLAAKDALTDVSGAPSGTQVRVRAVITGDAQLLGWGWGWY